MEYVPSRYELNNLKKKIENLKRIDNMMLENKGPTGSTEELKISEAKLNLWLRNVEKERASKFIVIVILIKHVANVHCLLYRVFSNGRHCSKRGRSC